jgi:hypothetical protein
MTELPCQPSFDAPEIPFPIEVPFVMRADLSKLGSSRYGQLETGHFCLDSDFPTYQKQKLELSESCAERRRCIQTDDQKGLRTALERTRDLFVSVYPKFAPSIPRLSTPQNVVLDWRQPLRSMKPEVMRYKGSLRLYQAVLSWLEQR